MELPEELVGIEEELETDDEPEDEEVERRTVDRGEDEERVQFVHFDLGTAEYAVHVDAVLRVVDVGERTRVPRASEAVDGITDLRGEITPVIDPRKLFGHPPSDVPDAEQDLLVFATGSDAGNAALRIDAVEGVELVPVSQVVLEPEDLASEDPAVEDLLSDPKVAGLIRDRVEAGVADYTPVIDVDAVLEATREEIERPGPA